MSKEELDRLHRKAVELSKEPAGGVGGTVSLDPELLKKIEELREQHSPKD